VANLGRIIVDLRFILILDTSEEKLIERKKPGITEFSEKPGFGIPLRGVEQTLASSQNSHAVKKGGADSGARSLNIDEQLTRVVKSWPNLSHEARRGIISIVIGVEPSVDDVR